ncbi:YafY family transcriptional regulator [Enterococcus raffinosus]|uniref:helix-turn-helix transcriptional regulator n=1 Tax=Enterococcus raffinosus TaxID=71452 RepID=UPI001C1009C9|nr:YafY family protein [Enterococcus raffinosus]MBU5360235.1 YafY family transcriptional regulator [Enterococcus raffinosus]
MIESRLLQILFILLEKGSATAPDLAEKFEVSPRTIYRDIDALSAAGIPVYAVRGKGGGIFIQENYVLDKAVFSDKEQQHILIALQNLNLANETLDNSLISKLSTMFKKEALDWLEIDFSDWTGLRNELFDQLQQAIFSRNVIQINYLSTREQFTARRLDPLKLVFRNKAWYLYAFCHLRADYRLFKIARMRDVQILSESFSRETPKKIFSEKPRAPEKQVELILLFDYAAAYRVQEEFKNVQQNQDNRLIAVVTLPDDETTINYLLSFGDHLEILEPPTFREKMAKQIEKLSNKYKT